MHLTYRKSALNTLSGNYGVARDKIFLCLKIFSDSKYFCLVCAEVPGRQWGRTEGRAGGDLETRPDSVRQATQSGGENSELSLVEVLQDCALIGWDYDVADASSLKDLMP